MKTFENKKVAAATLIPLGIGAVGGFINGFSGAGAGMVFLWYFNRSNRDNPLKSGKDSFAETVMAVLPLSALSSVVYSAKTGNSAEGIIPFILPAITGGVLGAYLTDKLNTEILRKIFAVIVIIAGINMIL